MLALHTQIHPNVKHNQPLDINLGRRIDAPFHIYMWDGSQMEQTGKPYFIYNFSPFVWNVHPNYFAIKKTEHLNIFIQTAC